MRKTPGISIQMPLNKEIYSVYIQSKGISPNGYSNIESLRGSYSKICADFIGNRLSLDAFSDISNIIWHLKLDDSDKTSNFGQFIMQNGEFSYRVRNPIKGISRIDNVIESIIDFIRSETTNK